MTFAAFGDAFRAVMGSVLSGTESTGTGVPPPAEERRRPGMFDASPAVNDDRPPMDSLWQRDQEDAEYERELAELEAQLAQQNAFAGQIDWSMGDPRVALTPEELAAQSQATQPHYVGQGQDQYRVDPNDPYGPQSGPGRWVGGAQDRQWVPDPVAPADPRFAPIAPSSHYAGAGDFNEVASPYKAVTLQGLQAAGLWNDIDNPSSALWQAYGANGRYDPNDRRNRARALLSLAGLTWQSRPEDFEAAFGGQNISAETANEIYAELQEDFERYQKSEAENQMMGSLVFGGLGGAFFAPAMADLGATLAGGSAGTAGLSQAELAALIESGTMGGAGAGLEAAAGIGASGLGGMLAKAPNIATNLMLTGDPKAALAGLVKGGGLEAGMNFAAPYVNAGLDFGRGMLGLDAPVDPTRMARSVQVADAGEADFSPMFEGDPADFDWREHMTDPNTTAGQRLLSDPNLTTQAVSTIDAANRAAPESGDTPPASNITGADLQRYMQISQTVDGLLGGAPDAPQRAEGQSDEQYADSLVTYLGVDAATMAEQGLTPGTPEYYEYIMAQSDAIIQQILGEGYDDGTLADEDVDADELSAALRDKTDAELQQLQRALFVRGQMDVLMGSGQYEDPFTGEGEDVIAPEGMLVNPSTAAYHRGLARSTDQLAGLRGGEAVDFLNDRIGRDVDLFGMQGAADARFEQAKLEDDERRRRGMLSY